VILIVLLLSSALPCSHDSIKCPAYNFCNVNAISFILELVDLIHCIHGKGCTPEKVGLVLHLHLRYSIDIYTVSLLCPHILKLCVVQHR